MKKIFKLGIGFFIIFSMIFALYGQEDAEGCKDHPLLTRISNFYISGCIEKDYSKVYFEDENGNEIEVEGRVTIISYWLKGGFQPPGELKVVRNFENAIKKIGGVIVKEYSNEVYLKLEKGGKIYWIHVDVTNDGAHYELTIVEKTIMEQEVVADPKALANDIAKTGHASVYGIYFDVDSDVIKPESEPTLKAIAEMLKANPNLKVYVVGHTDMTGSFEHNMDLSLRRAKSVVKALVSKYGISRNRLKAEGVGPLSPVSTNKTEEGRKLNRRVELVEML